MGEFLLSWLLVPVLLCALSLGCGLLVARVSAPRREPFPGVLVVPLGFAAVVALAALLTTWKATAPLAGVGPAAVAAVGFYVGRDRLRAWWPERRSMLLPAVAAILPAGVVAAPVVVTGQPGFTGFGRITDLAHQLSFIEWLRTEGRTQIGAGRSSYEEIVDKLVTSDYPGGLQAVVAAMGDLARLDIAWAYQPVLAFVAAMLGLALYSLLQRAIPSAPWRAAAAGVAAQPTILIAYTLAAGIKEIGGAASIALVAAVFAHRRPLGWSTLVPGAVALASAYSIFNLTVVPWLGVIVAVMLVYDLLEERRPGRVVTRWAGIVGLTAVFAVPAVVAGLTLLRAAGGATGPEGLGNLAAPVPGWAAVGPWMTLDHRFPLGRYADPTPTYVLIAIALVLALVGFAAAFRARDRGLVALGLSGAIAMAFILSASSTWVQLKAFCMTAPISLTLAFAGAAWLTRRAAWLRPAGLLAGLAVAGGVVYGSALQYHHTTLVDYERMNDLKAINARFAGQGPALFPNFDEFAEHFLRDARASGLVNPWQSTMTYNRTAAPGLQAVRDTDDYDQRFLQRFRLIIRRRDPTDSRPPSNYALVHTTPFYEVWRRAGDPRRIAAHYPLRNTSARQRSARRCAAVADSVRRAGAGASIRYALPTPAVAVVANERTRPPAWRPVGDALHAGTPGRWSQGFRVGRAGEYRMFIRGSFGRRVTISIDGRPIGSLRWRESYPGQFSLVATMRLTAGEHALSVERPGGSLLPGTGNDASGQLTTIGPVVAAPVTAREVVRSAPASGLSGVCRSDRPLDWIEVIRRS
jgi:hypothetical protein